MLREVGLGYLRLGQPATELSGGEAQRIKLATELQRAQRGDTLYVLDEPTTGLHPADVEKLLAQLDGLVEAGNTVIVVEHDMAVVAASDWVIDIGPGAGDEGGRVVAAAPPREVARAPTAARRRIWRVILPPASVLGRSVRKAGYALNCGYFANTFASHSRSQSMIDNNQFRRILARNVAAAAGRRRSQLPGVRRHHRLPDQCVDLGRAFPSGSSATPTRSARCRPNWKPACAVT